MQSRFVVALEDPFGVAIWEIAHVESAALYHDFLGTEHLLIALSRADGGYTDRLLTRLNVAPRLLRAMLRSRAGAGSSRYYPGHAPSATPRLAAALKRAQAALPDGKGMGERELLLAVLEGGPGLAVRVLAEKGATAEEMAAWVREDTGPEATRIRKPGDEAPLASSIGDPDVASLLAALGHGPGAAAGVIPGVGVGDGGAGGVSPDASLADTPMLARYGRDLVAEARNGRLHEAFGRQRELVEIVRALARQDRNVPILVGDAGVGKTAIVEGLAWRLAQPRPLTPILEGKRLVALDMASLEAGAGVRGEFEERLQRILRECAAHPEIIIFLDEVHTIVGAGHSNHSHDAAQMLKSALASGQLKLIGATTPEEYDRYLASDSALERRMQPIRIEELSEEATLQLLEAVAPRYAEQYHVRLLPEAMKAAVELSARYLPERRLPDKALDLLDSACASLVVGDQLSLRAPASSLGQEAPRRVSGAGRESGENGATIEADAPAITRAMIAEVVAERLGAPVGEITASDQQRLLALPDALKLRIIAQDDAIASTCDALQLARAGLRDQRRPRAILFFAGPTGVGKTELARVLAETLFGSAPERNLLRLDMAEFAQEHQVAQLIGAPPGYVGYEREGRLTGWLRHHPYSVVLFDEIEKAHPRVHALLLGLFDNGEITDGQGRTFSGREAIFILTSNLVLHLPEQGTSGRIGFLGRSSQPVSSDRALRQELRRSMPHEWVNRLDRVVLFRHLETPDLLQIVELQLGRLREALKEQGTILYVRPEVKTWLVAHGTDPESGARELARVIERELSSRIARLQLSGKLGAKAALYASVKDDQLTVTAGRK